MTGCGASVTVYDYTAYDGTRYNGYEVTVDYDTIGKMEATAAANESGQSYTVDGYLKALFESFGYKLGDAAYTEKGYTVYYEKAVGERSELDMLGSMVEFETTYGENAFIRTYNSVSPNPFNGLREAYDGVDPDRHATVLERIKNGVEVRDEYGEISTAFPSIYTVFPYLNTADPDGLLLNYVFTGARRMKCSGIKLYEDGSTAQYLFSRYFDTSETTIEFEYVRPIVYGWYLVAVCAGLVVFAAISIALKLNKNNKNGSLMTGDNVRDKTDEGEENNA